MACFVVVRIILGIVEGLTEFLPVSSTAHLLVAERIMSLGGDWEAFTVVIQLGAILAVVAYYFRTFWTAMVGLPNSADARRFAFGLVLALLPSVVAGMALKKLLDRVLLNDGDEWLAYEVLNQPISWLNGFSWQRYSSLLAGEVHVRRVE